MFAFAQEHLAHSHRELPPFLNIHGTPPIMEASTNNMMAMDQGAHTVSGYVHI